MKRTIYFNEDNHHFYGAHPPEDMSVEGLNRLVDTYAEATQVAGVLFCVNVQRALFDSKVWEHFWDDYDPALGDDQPALKRTHGVKNHLLLRERDIDQFTVWLERCRHHGIEGWLTMRMNDCHGLKECSLTMAGIEDHSNDWTANWPSKFWRENPQLRRAPYRLERSWEGAFDYGLEEVRDHHFRLVEELFERYDMFGFEMDWMRWGMYFAPGCENAGMPILTEFVRKVRKLADECEKRVGHPIRLAHRIPATPQSCLALGFDPVTWAREGLADMITLSSFCGGADYNYPISIWRAMLGDDVKLLALADETAKPCPEECVNEYECLYGAAASALQRGADGVYLFNQNYRETSDPELFAHMLRHVGEIDTVKECRRRHVVTYPQVDAPGLAIGNVLPIPLRQPRIGTDFGRMEDNITLRLNTGPKPEEGKATLVMGFAGVPEGMTSQVTVRTNTKPLKLTDQPQYESISQKFSKDRHGWNSDFIDEIRCYDVPLEILLDGDNVFEIIPPQVDGQLVLAEVLIEPGPKSL